MAAKFLVKEALFEDVSRNPFARGGHVIRYGKWKTIARCDTAREAVAQLHGVKTGLRKRGIWYRGRRIDKPASRLNEHLKEERNG